MAQVNAQRSLLNSVVGTAALVAPALHSATDLMEWYQGGFSPTHLWLNYLAFLPMPWLLFGLCAVRQLKPDLLGLVGALLYGVAFTYFAHTTLYAISEHIPTYEILWSRLGVTYTAHGALMVAGGFMFSWSALRGGWLPKTSILIFAVGIALNLILAILPGPDILQIIGTAARNAGLMGMGYAVMFNNSQAPA
jgi:hypothetical protein